MAGYDWNFSTDYYSGPQQQKSLVLKNTGSSASNTLDNAIVNFNKAEIQGSGSNNSTITVNQIFGERIQTTANQDSGDTTNIGTNFGLHYASPANLDQAHSTSPMNMVCIWIWRVALLQTTQQFKYKAQ
jgi:hypothetical protein